MSVLHRRSCDLIAAHVDVLLFPGAMAGAALSLIDLLRVANTIARLQRSDAAPQIGWRLLDENVRPVRSSHPLAGHYAKGPAKSEHCPRRAVFVPPLHADTIPALRKQVARWSGLRARVAAAFDAGELVMTLGNSAWLAAASGRMQGCKLTLPWFYVGGFRTDFPDIEVVPGRAWLHDGPLLSGAEMETLDELGLELVRLAAGDALAQACANAYRHAPQRHHAAVQAAAQHHIAPTRDSALSRAIDWMGQHLERPYRLDEVARAAAVSPRTLLRHFREVLGHTPLAHLHRLRCERAQVLLEITLDGIPAIAEACGYADPAAFRRIFRRHVAMSPAAYRQRYALRSSRSRWKVEAR